jgi:hypothetical protein
MRILPKPLIATGTAATTTVCMHELKEGCYLKNVLPTTIIGERTFCAGSLDLLKVVVITTLALFLIIV